MRHWLVLDIGNTHSVAGIYPIADSASPLSSAKARLVPVAEARFRTDASVTVDEYRAQLSLLLGASLQ